MQYKRTIVVALLATMTAAAGLSCSSSPETVDDEPLPVEAPRADAADAFDAAAPWLPAEADVVVSLAGKPLWDALGYSLLPTTNPDADPGALGTIDGLRADFGDILGQYLGFDFGQSYSLVTAVDVEGALFSAVLLGDFDEPADTPTVDVGAHTAYEIDIGTALEEVLGPGAHSIYALPIDEPRRGLVIAERPDALEQLSAAHNDGSTLAAQAGDDTFSRLFTDADGAAFAVAMSAEHMEPMLAEFAAMGVPVPSAAVVSFGDDLAATVEGDPTDLERIIALVGDQVEAFRNETEARYDADDGSYLERLEAIYLHHTVSAVADQLQPQLDGHRLRYEIELTDDGSRFDVLLASAIPYALFTARTAFETYEQRAKSAEADGVLSAAAMGAQMYCEGRQLYSDDDGAEPWHEANDDQPEGTPVPLDERVFPGGPDITVTTAPRVPEGGEQIEYAPQLEGDADFDPQDVLAVLNIQDEPSYFRYTYETGPGIGQDATAKLVAEANFDPSSPHHHRVVLHLDVDENHACLPTPSYIENEGH